jgi:hypothetical protein
VADAAERGAARFSYLSAVPAVVVVVVVVVVECLTKCSCIGLSSQRIPWELVVLFSFAVLLSHGCTLGMTLDEVPASVLPDLLT